MSLNKIQKLTFKPLAISLLLILSYPLKAQIWLSNEDIYNEAEEYFIAEEYNEALPLYQLLEKKEMVNANIQYKIGECYLKIKGRKTKAIPYLEKAVKNASVKFNNSFADSTSPINAYLSLGIAYRINSEFDKAILTFNILLDSIKENQLGNESLVEWHIAKCKNAKLIIEAATDYNREVLNSDINGAYNDYNPIIVNNGANIFYMSELKFYDAINTSEGTIDQWPKPTNLTPKIGSDGDHILVGSNSNGTALLFYDFDPENSGEIYVSYKENNDWTKIQPFTAVNSVYNETYASFADNGNTVYFTSNRPGSIGGADIWRVTKTTDSTWSLPVNLGAIINSPYNEASPFYLAKEQMLYFSSEGHFNMGGYDIFKASKDGNSKWSSPLNLGIPYSSTDDDIFYYPIDDGVGYTSQFIEEETQLYDIVKLTKEPELNASLQLIKATIDSSLYSRGGALMVLVIDDNTNDTVRRKNLESGQTTYQTLVPYGSYSIMVNENGETVYKKKITAESNSIGEIPLLVNNNVSANEKDIKDTANTKVTEVTEPASSAIKIESRIIFFAFDSSTLEGKYFNSLNELATILNTHTDIKIELTGYTDDIGDYDYNLKLGERRAVAVKNYLLSKNVNELQISVQTNGEKSIANKVKEKGISSELRSQYRKVSIEMKE